MTGPGGGCQDIHASSVGCYHRTRRKSGSILASLSGDMRGMKLLIWRRPGALKRWILVACLLFLAGAGWVLWPFWQLSSQFADHQFKQPSRLYAQPMELVRGQPVSFARLRSYLAETGYQRARRPLSPGQYYQYAGELEVDLRAFPTAGGIEPVSLLKVHVTDGVVSALERAGTAVSQASLEPPLLASYYGADRRERRVVSLAALPDFLVHAVLAAEDSGFFSHGGISLSGTLRAAWVDLKSGSIEQGGSTLTQQLVKNLYLSHRRTLARKVREAILAVLLELRYSKRQILDAYLNEIYWGGSNGVSYMGVGAAAHGYFGKPASQLTLAESALLAGMIRAPADYSPIDHPVRAKKRRDEVLRRMSKLGWLQASRLEQALAAPIHVSPQPPPIRRAPYFADFMRREAKERFGVGELDNRGFSLLSTLIWKEQQVAEGAVRWGVAALKKGWEKGHRRGVPLEAALVSVDPRTGGLGAYVGGADYARSQFDRASQALRQTGSAFKPVVYAAAFEDGVASPATLLADEPLTVTVADHNWTPRNDDHQFLGWVSARTALEQSRNVPTARLALQVGLPRIVELAHQLGISTSLEPVPALALGAFSVTPVDLAQVYSTLADHGFRRQVHGLTAILDPTGQPLPARGLERPERVLSPQGDYLVTSVLQGVLNVGTGAAARNWGLHGPLAGKTGTSNDGRDSWFAGYAPDRA
ncbi:MAG TPA: transglycosylase domain-containing protein, partial [Thermoanaerobaculia bacterium]|nr:transglycosylase domain-containing protein [Thermoanaerobaculia bacterium]